jgi:hypothetical protein
MDQPMRFHASGQIGMAGAFPAMAIVPEVMAEDLGDEVTESEAGGTRKVRR